MKDFSLASVSKALGGALAAAVVAYAARHGVVLSADVSNAVAVLISAVVGFAVVYLAPKNK